MNSEFYLILWESAFSMTPTGITDLTQCDRDTERTAKQPGLNPVPRCPRFAKIPEPGKSWGAHVNQFSWEASPSHATESKLVCQINKQLGVPEHRKVIKIEPRDKIH